MASKQICEWNGRNVYIAIVTDKDYAKNLFNNVGIDVDTLSLKFSKSELGYQGVMNNSVFVGVVDLGLPSELSNDEIEKMFETAAFGLFKDLEKDFGDCGVSQRHFVGLAGAEWIDLWRYMKEAE